LKQTLKIGAMLLVIAALTMTGVALAQSGSDQSGGNVAASATTDHPVVSKILEWLAPLVDDGTITQSQADAVAQALAQDLPAPGTVFRAVFRGVELVREAADFLGMTPQEIAQAMRDGSTLAQIAADHGSSGQDLIDHLVGVVGQQLDQAVANGRLTADQATQALANATERITALVNGEAGRGPAAGFMGPMGHFRGHGTFGDHSGSDDPST
jgi:polyhydroxyalkanoate synthesis regulator phasin